MKNKKEIPAELPYKLLIPSKINVEPLLEAQGYSPTEVKRYSGWLYYTINYIEVYLLTHFDADNHKGYSIVNFDLLGKVIGQNNVKFTIDFLLKNNIIETTGSYKSQAKHGKGVSTGYRITTQFISPITPKTIDNKFIIKKLQDKSWQNCYDVRAKAGQYIYSMMHKHIKIKRKAAEAYVKAKYDQSVALISKLSKRGKLIEYSRLSTEESYYYIEKGTLEELLKVGLVEDLLNLMTRMYNRDLNSIIRIDKKDFYVSEGVTGRIFTNLTSMSSGLRDFLYHKDYKGSTLINIDIRNSQPFLLNRLLKTHYQKLGKELPEDVVKYIKLTSKGRLYETVMKEMGQDYEDDVLRRRFKKIFFGKILYCKNTTTAKSQEGKAFKKLFPSVAKFIRTEKAGEAKDSYKRLAQELQKVEAKIIIKAIAREMQKRRIWCSTIHDSIIVLPQDVKTVKGIIMAKFDVEYDLKPSINEEELKPRVENVEIIPITPQFSLGEAQLEKTIEEMEAEFLATFDDEAFKKEYGLSIHELPF